MLYLIIEAGTADRMVAELADFLDAGWKPHGALLVVHTPPDEDGTYYTKYIQAIVKDG